MQKLWLYLHFPQLQLDSILQQSSHQTAEQAYVIVDEHKHQICQLNSLAYQGGIRRGMGIGTAAMLMSELIVLPHQSRVAKGILNEIAHNLYLTTSDINFWGEQGLLLQIHNMLHMHGGLAQYWHRIQNSLPKHVNYDFASGITPLAARLLATTQYNQITSDPVQLRQAIEPINLKHTELACSVIDKLQRVGIRSVKDLLNIPFSELAKRFDSEVTHYIGQLTALIPHPINWFHPKQQFERYLELLFDIEHSQVLLKPLSLLLKPLESFLKNRDLLTDQIVIELYQRDKQKLSITVTSRQGEYLISSWLKLIELKLANITLSAPVFGISLLAQHTYIRSPDKQDLFKTKQGTLNQLQLLSILQAKLGQQALVKPSVSNSFLPESMNHNHQLPAGDSASVPLYPMRPSFLLTPPIPLQEKVTIAYGPERINTAWWQGPPITRDYFIAYTHSGKWYWIYKNLENQWYLHGVFS